MDCQHCCGADQLFDLKGARKEMKKYQKKGPGKSTNKLLEKFNKTDIPGKSLLDIGGGIGAIQWYFQEHQASKTTDIDASRGYLEVASQFAKKNGWGKKGNFIFGDITNLKEKIIPHDYVTLDKVVCCYPDYQSLLTTATELCKDTLGLTFPLRNPISRILILLSRIYFYFRKNPFRTYIHSPENMSAFIQTKGFKPVYQGISFPWHVQVYKKIKE